MIPASEEQDTNIDFQPSIEFQFPTLPLNASLASWLNRSQVLIMGSTADDSSVDENMSSIEDSVWDIIDEASVATSDDEDQNLSRQPTPSSDGHDQEMEGSYEDTSIGYESQSRGLSSSPDGLSMDTDMQQGGTEAVEDLWNSELTSFGIHDNAEVKRDHAPNAIHTQRSIKFHESRLNKEVSCSEDVNVVHTVKVFEGKERDELCRCLRLTSPPSRIVGTIRQCMHHQALRLNGPYKLLYVGSSSAKQAIIKKISAALALSTTSAVTKSPPAKFSIIPISAFGGETSPEVVLIDHTGLEIHVEECTSASYVKEDDGKDTIHLNLDDGRSKISSYWNNKSFTLLNNDKNPDIAIVCIPNDESTAAKQTRVLARSFISRHDIPVIVISVEPGWSKHSQAMTLDYKTPHCSVEAYEPQDDISRVLKRLPINLSSFLNIEAVQMNRNLACLRQVCIDNGRNGVKQVQPGNAHTNSPGLGTKKGWFNKTSFQTFLGTWPASKLARLLIYVALFSIVLLSLDGSKLATTYGKNSREIVASPSPQKLQPATAPVTFSPLSTALDLIPKNKVLEKSELLRTKSLFAHTSTELASVLLESYPTAPNRSQKFQIHVVGDCHIILQPPHWFTVLRRSPALLFKVTRRGEPLDYSFSAIFEGVYALQLSNEDAYGTVDVLVWTIKKPKIHESLQVDFGNPWLRVAGWRKASQVATSQAREELQSAQTSLASVYEQAADGIQTLMKQAVAKAEYALKEVEKAGLTSLHHTVKTTEIMIAQSKGLSRTLTQQVQHQGSKATSHLITQQERLHRDIAGFSRKMSDLLLWQAQIISNAASRLNVITLTHELQEYRETHLIESQKQAIRLWWNLRGGPPPKKPTLKKEPNSNREGQIS